MRYIIALDEGTTSTRAVLYDVVEKKIVNRKSSEIKQIYPRPAFVEEDADEIYSQTLASLVYVLESVDDLSELAGIGITNQRETVVAWDKKTGKPLYNAVVWQCRRTAEYMRSLSDDAVSAIRKKTGLLPDAYFSASKIKWLVDNVPEIADKAAKNEVCFGTVDSYLVYKLTNGKSFVTDVTNASRTMLFNLKTLDWDDELLDFFNVPKCCLPKIVDCDEVVGHFEYKGTRIPVCGIAGDQQAAMIGQGCFSRGECKATYGTGLFILSNIGGEYREPSDDGLLTTVAYKIGDELAYAAEGSVFNAGSTIQWLRDNLGLFKSSRESEALATSVEDNGGVYLVPAFTGLGAPLWNADARGLICGLTRASGKAHITRAALESMAYSVKDIAEAVANSSKTPLTTLKVDGGVSSNSFLMQFQADVCNVTVDRPLEKESTVLGAVYLCGLGTGALTLDDVKKARKSERLFTPSNDPKFEKYYENWLKAVRRCVYDE